MININVAIADDYKIFREGLKVGLRHDRHLHINLEAGNGIDLLDGLKKIEVDVILMDLKMPLMDGIDTTRQVKNLYPAIKVIVITMYDDEKFIIHLMENGASGYLLKNAEPVEIRNAIYAVYKNGYYFNDLVNKILLKKLIIRTNIRPSFNNGVELTERELEVLQLICGEKTANEIAQQIFLSPRSVEGIKQRLIEKIGVRNTAGLVMFAVKNGIM